MPTARQSTRNFKGDHLSIKMFKNDDGSDVVDDWDTLTETGTDNTTGIRAALSVLKPGQSLHFPFGGTGIYLITAPLVIPRRVTLRGADRIHCEIRYIGTAPQPAVLNLVGSEGVTIKHIAVMAWGDDPDNFPKTVLMLARTTDDHYGHHMFHQCSFMGNTAFATIYSIASEENSFKNCNFYGNNGKGNAGTANHIVYLSSDDDASICVPAAHNGESNLDIWFLHCHFINFGAQSSDNDCVYEKMFAGGGDHVFRDCYMSPSARGSTLGWGFRFVADPTFPYSGMNYVVEAIRMENGEGMFRLEKGTGPGVITGLRISKNTLGVSAGYLIYGEDDAIIHESTWEQNFPPSPTGAVSVSVDKMQFTRVMEDYDQDFTVRTIATYCYIHLSSTLANLNLGVASFNNFIILHDTCTLNGALQGTVTVQGRQVIESAGLGGVSGLLIRDANGVTTGKALELRDFAGNAYFAIYGGTDSGFPGTAQVRDILPWADDTYNLGNLGLLFGKIFTHNLLIADLAASGPLRGSSGDVVYGPVDVGVAVDIAATGFSSGDLAEWDGAKFVPGSGGSTLPVADTTAVVKGSSDASKLVRIEADGLTTATTRVATMPDRNITLNKLDTLAATASSSLTLTSSYADIVGDTVTLTQNGEWQITATVKFTADAASSGVSAQLVVVSTPYGADMSSDVVGTYTLSRTWKYTNSGGSQAIKIQAKKTGGAGVSTAYSGSSDIIAVFLG